MSAAAKEEIHHNIIIKKVKKVEGGGHHGGAWKVAYADFVTAMMAFFLLLWLLNVTTSEQKMGIADYFSPTSVSNSQSGAGGILAGRSMVQEGARLTDNTLFGINTPTHGIAVHEHDGEGEDPNKPDASEMEDEDLRDELSKREEQQFQQAEQALREAIAANPELADLNSNLMIDSTTEGLRIQIVDQQGSSMFPSGSASMYQRTQTLMNLVAEGIGGLPNKVSIRGHTDSAPFRNGGLYTNWELSADRANASRRVLLNAGIPANRIANVVGKADRDHLVAEDPMSPQNRRISIIMLREVPLPATSSPGG